MLFKESFAQFLCAMGMIRSRETLEYLLGVIYEVWSRQIELVVKELSKIQLAINLLTVYCLYRMWQVVVVCGNEKANSRNIKKVFDALKELNCEVGPAPVKLIDHQDNRGALF